jgi:TolB protein
MRASSPSNKVMPFGLPGESARKDWDGPLLAIWALDLATEKATRLTPKSLYAWDVQWLDADSILFVSQAVGEKEQAIYRMSATSQGKDRKRLVKEARTPSAAP